MYKHLFRFLSVMLFVIVICGTVQATSLELTVRDSLDNTTIPHATVFVDGVNTGRTNTLGQFYIAHSGARDLRLRITSTGYDDWASIVSSNLTSLIVNMTRKSLILKVNVFDSDTLLPVPGASIVLTAENVTKTSETDSSGIASFAVRGGTLYTIEITSQNYQPRSGTVDIGSSNTEVQYWLLSGNRFSFVVKDQDGITPVPDAEVRIDTILAGKTDSRGILTSRVGRGKTYSIEIKKEGYLPYIASRTISDTDALLTVLMNPAQIGAFIYILDETQSPVNQAEIYLNGKFAGTTNQYGRYTLSNVVAGNYLIEVRKTGLVKTEKTISISKQGDEVTIIVPFTIVDLTVYAQDKDQKVLPDVTILVNNEKRGITDSHGQLVTNVKLNTLNNITAVKDGYQTVSVQKEIKQENITPSVVITLEKNLDWGFIGWVVAGVVAVILIFAIISIGRSRPRRHIIRKDEI